jgi:hypothetical protein
MNTTLGRPCSELILVSLTAGAFNGAAFASIGESPRTAATPVEDSNAMKLRRSIIPPVGIFGKNSLLMKEDDSLPEAFALPVAIQ